MKSKFVGHFCCTHSIGEILLIRKHKENSITELILVQHSVELVSCSINTVRVVRIDHEDETLGILVVVAPQGTDLILAADIPNSKRDVLVLNSLNIEAW